MGIRIYDKEDNLLVLGFHPIQIPVVEFNIEYLNQIDIWCQKYLQGEYAIKRFLEPGPGGYRSSAGYFRSDADAMMFILRWS